MTNSKENNSSERLDRIERILESVAQRTDSNARTIQGMLERRESERLEHEEKMAVMSDAIQRLIRVEEGLVNMVANVDENQPTILRS